MSYQYLIFDLDETLYPRHTGLMDAISRRMMLYMTTRLGFALDEAAELRRRFYAQYGTSLLGLQVEYSVDAQEYLAFVHDIPLQEYIWPDPSLDAMLGHIPLLKAILTNADAAHAHRVMDRLGVTHHFPVVVDICAMQYQCKPNAAAYRCLLDILGVPGAACILVEDLVRNLRPARELFDITTILVDGDKGDGVDYAIGNLLELEDLVDRLLRAGSQESASALAS